MKILDLNGVSILWQRIKTMFARKNETVSNISRNNTTFTATRADGTTFTFDQKDTTYNNATTTTAGLMSATDKAKLNSIENGAQENVVESVSVNGTKQAVTNKGINITVPTAVSDLNNDLGYLTEESDPTVPSWAKQAQKPVYTASEVGALSADTKIPTRVSDLTDDSGHYTKPSGGIPSTDLSSDILTTLEKADTVVQDVSDVQDAIARLTEKLNTLADSDDTTLDQMSEIVAYIKNNKSLIDGITTGKVSVADIVDNLTSNAANKPLSAKQGKILKDLIDGIVVPTKTSELTNDSGFVTNSDIATPDWNAASDESGYIDNKPNIRQGTDANHTAVAENSGTTASGIGSHAEGGGTTASGSCSHAEGGGTKASNYASHAEGGGTTASGSQAHAEGGGTTASGSNAHAEGFNTIANHRSQHTFGEYNIEDPSSATAASHGNYIEIVGNGTSSSNRSNARTLDWNGNEILAGKLTVGSDPTSNMDVATKKYVDDNIPTVPTNVSSFTNDAGYLTQHQDISGKANISDLSAVATSGSYNDLSNKPTIPTVPTNVSAFNNDASYADEQYVDDAIATALADVVGIDYHVCTAQEYDAQTYIPTLEGAPGVIYLVPKPASLIGSATVGSSSVSGNNIYYEFIYNGRSFEMIGDTQVSLDGYLEDSDISTDAQVQTVITEVFGGE